MPLLLSGQGRRFSCAPVFPHVLGKSDTLPGGLPTPFRVSGKRGAGKSVVFLNAGNLTVPGVFYQAETLFGCCLWWHGQNKVLLSPPYFSLIHLVLIIPV